MSDFSNLNGQQQMLLQVKLDGLIEVCVHSARVQNIGLSEALNLTMRALLREISARNIDPAKAGRMWTHAISEAFSAAASTDQVAIN